MNKLKVACVKALLLSKYKKRENRTTIYILNTVSITPHSNSLQQNIDNSKSHFTSISTSKTTSMINNIRKATDEYIHQSSNMSRRSSIINTSSNNPFPTSTRLQRNCNINNNLHDQNLSKGANRTIESNSSVNKSNSTQSSNSSSSFCLSTESSSQQKLEFLHSNRKKSDCSFQEIEDVNQYFNRKHKPSHLLSHSKYFPF